MAGDAFLFHGKKVEVVVVDLIRNLVGIIEDGETSGYKYVKTSELEPIPITRDMVLRNGFKLDHYPYELEDNEYETDDKRLRLTDVSATHGEGVWYLHIDDEDMDSVANIMVDSFHDLQHAYRRYNIERGLVY